MLIVSYDISDNKLRTKFAKVLSEHGRRLQYSVFEIKNTDKILNLLLLTIEKKFAKQFDITDSIVIFTVCEACLKKTIRYGYAVHEEQELVFL